MTTLCALAPHQKQQVPLFFPHYFRPCPSNFLCPPLSASEDDNQCDSAWPHRWWACPHGGQSCAACEERAPPAAAAAAAAAPAFFIHNCEESDGSRTATRRESKTPALSSDTSSSVFFLPPPPAQCSALVAPLWCSCARS